MDEELLANLEIALEAKCKSLRRDNMSNKEKEALAYCDKMGIYPIKIELFKSVNYLTELQRFRISFFIYYISYINIEIV